MITEIVAYALMAVIIIVCALALWRFVSLFE